MRKSDLTFGEGFTSNRATEAKSRGAIHKAFDWDKAAEIIREKYETHKDLVAEAGLEGDWDYTGGEIFSNGKPTNDDYTFLQSNWAIPTLILTYDGNAEELECWTEGNDRFNSGSKWDETSLEILGINLK